MEEYIYALLVIFIFSVSVLIGVIAFSKNRKLCYYPLEFGHYFYLALSSVFIGTSIFSENNPPLSWGIYLLIVSVVLKILSEKIKKNQSDAK